jgi:hypothetical protein
MRRSLGVRSWDESERCTKVLSFIVFFGVPELRVRSGQGWGGKWDNMALGSGLCDTQVL